MSNPLDRILGSRVSLCVRSLSPILLGATLALNVGGACGGKADSGKTTPGSTGTVSSGTSMNPALDPANMDPAGEVPMADPNDRPPELASPDDTPAGADEPSIAPPGLDITAEERNRRVSAHLQDANAAIQNDADPERTISEAKAALQVDETSIEAMVLLAHGNIVKGFYDLAEDVLMKAFERGGKSNKKAFFLLGLVYEKTKRHEKAPAAYQNALVLDPNYRSALMNLGVYHLRTKRYPDAVQIYERLTGSLGVDSAAAWTNLGSAYRGNSASFAATDITMRNNLVLKSEEALRRAISKDKNYSNAHYNMGLLYLDADPFPTPGGEMDKITRLKKAKGYFDEYRRLPSADVKLVDETTAVTQKLIAREELIRKKKADREAKRRALAEKKAKRAAEKAARGEVEMDDDEGFE